MGVTNSDIYTIPVRRDGQIDGGTGGSGSGSQQGGVSGGATAGTNAQLLAEVTAREAGDASLSTALSTEVTTSVHKEGTPLNNSIGVFSGSTGNLEGKSDLMFDGTLLSIGGNTQIGGNLTVSGTSTMKDDIVSDFFASGFAGSGFKIDKELNGDYSATFDNLTIRKMMKVYELQISKISAVNGGLIISCANGRSIGISGTTQVWFDTNIVGGVPKSPIQFIANDWVRAQTWNNGVSYLLAQVDTVGTSYITLKNITGAIFDPMDLVQVGHPTDVTRQNLIYITASDNNNPYIDMIAGCTNGNFSGKQKARIGNLSGISDSSFGGNLSGYGIWSDNMYLHGQIVIANPTTAGIPYAGASTAGGSATSIVGQGALATQNSVTTGQVSGLGSLATQNSVAYNDLTGTKPPTNATYGADWNSTLSGKPTGTGSLVSTPNATGLLIDGTHLGYYIAGTTNEWRTYMDSSGNFSCGNTNTGPGITWNQGGASLLIRGTFTVDAGTTGGWNVDTEAIWVGTKTATGYAPAGVTLHSNGSIHATNFYLNTDGVARFTAVDSNISTVPYVDGSLSGSLSHVQYYAAGTNEYYDCTRNGYPYNDYISVNGTTYSDVWQGNTYDTCQYMYYSSGILSEPNISISNYGSYLRITATNGQFSSFYVGNGWSNPTHQSYVAGTNGIDKITLTGSGGRCEINIDNYDEGAFGVNGVTMLWKGTLTDTAIKFVDIYSSHYAARGVTLTRSGYELTFEKGSAWTGTNAVQHHTEAFLGNIKIEGNEIYEDSVANDTDSVLKINYHSYGAGDAYNRITMIGGGRGKTMVNISGMDLSGLPAGLQVKEGCVSFPRHSTSSRNALSPLPGSVVFLEDGATKKLQVYDGSSWINLH